MSPYSGLAPDTVSVVCRPGPGSCSVAGVSGQYCSVSVDNVNSGDVGGQVNFNSGSSTFIIFSLFFTRIFRLFDGIFRCFHSR